MDLVNNQELRKVLAFADQVLNAALQQRPTRPGESPPDYRDLWERPHGLSHDFDPFDDLDLNEETY